MVQKREVPVSAYDRFHYGKMEHINATTRGIKVNAAYLRQLDLANANKLNIDRLVKTHPDSLQNAKLTFLLPNEYWKKNPGKCDVLGLDATDAPEWKGKEKPEHGIPGQVVKYKGELYVADGKGRFSTTQKKITEYKPEKVKKASSGQVEKKKEKESEPERSSRKEISRAKAKLKEINFKKDFTVSNTDEYDRELRNLTEEYEKINGLLYTPAGLSEIEVKKLKERREDLLKQREALKEKIKPERFFYSKGGLDISESNENTLDVGFEYEKYRDTPTSFKKKWRQHARWNPDQKKWFVYSNNRTKALELLYDQGLISEKPKSAPTLRDLYLSKKERRDNTQDIVIEIDDETDTARIDGDLEDLRKINDYYSYYMKGYKYSKKYKEGKWDGKVHIMRLGNRTLPKNLAYNIIEEQKKIDPDLNVKIVDFRRNAVKGKPFKLKDIQLYDYQQKAVQKALDDKQGLIVVATGGGKTEIASGIIAEYGEDNDSIFLVHTTALQDQAEERLEKRLGKDVGLGGGTKHDIKDTPKGDINVATLQSMYQAIKDREENKELTEKQKELLKAYEDAEVVIQDEAHHIKAGMFKKVFDQGKTKHAYGLTATPYRDENDELEVYSRFGTEVVNIPPDKLIKKGRLVPPVINIIDVEPTKQALALSKSGGKGSRLYNKIRKAQVINNESRNNYILDLAKNQEKKGKSTLIFVDRIEHGNKLAKMLNTPFLNGQSQSKKVRAENRDIVDKVSKGQVKTIIATQQLFGEGFDLPAIDSLIIADAGGKSKVKTMQRAGRALRTKTGKKKTEIFDFRDKVEYLEDHANERIQTYKENEEFHVKEQT